MYVPSFVKILNKTKTLKLVQGIKKLKLVLD